MNKNSAKKDTRTNQKNTKGYPKRNNRKDWDGNKDNVSQDKCNGRTSSLNDISWYNRYPELLQATSRVAFPYRPGMNVPMGQITTVNPEECNYTIPGVATLYWVPAFARSNKATDPMSIAAREIYAKVRSKFSSSLDADAPDFIMYIGALDSIFSYLGALKRLYRVLDVYSPNNYVLPDGLMNGMNISRSTVQILRTQKANFNFAINQLIRMSRKFILPATMDLFNRHYWMNDNVYADAPSISTQFYVFVQAGYYTYASLNTPDGVPAAGLRLIEAPWGSLHEWKSTTPVEDLYNFGTDLINTLSSWDDAYTISGYLMRAYEGAPQFTVDELPIDTAFEVAYVPEVLSQIHNSHGILANDAMSITNLRDTDVTQDPKTNAVLYNPKVKVSFSAFGTEYRDSKVCINLNEDVPTPEAVVIATRLNACLGDPTGEKDESFVICGTEIPMGWNVSIPSIAANDVTYSSYGLDQEDRLVFDDNTTGIDYDWKRLYLDMVKDAIEAFDWHPMIRMTYVCKTERGDVHSATYLRGDVRNITSVDKSTLENIHRICSYSEFNSFSE
jgi:hypothetical protein